MDRGVTGLMLVFRLCCLSISHIHILSLTLILLPLVLHRFQGSRNYVFSKQAYSSLFPTSACPSIGLRPLANKIVRHSFLPANSM